MRAFCKTRSDFHIEKTASSMRDFTWFISVSCFGESKVTVKTWLDKFREVRNILFLAGGWTSWVYRLVDNVTVSSWPFNGQKIGIRISKYFYQKLLTHFLDSKISDSWKQGIDYKNVSFTTITDSTKTRNEASKIKFLQHLQRKSISWKC